MSRPEETHTLSADLETGRVRVLVDPVPTSLLRTEVHASIRALEGEIVDEPDRFASRFYQGFAVLNACRMWCDSVTGEAGSKRRGARSGPGRASTRRGPT